MGFMLCIFYGGKMHCHPIPIYEIPITLLHGPGPINYQPLIHDLTLVASIQAAANKVQDKKVGAALSQGIQEAVKAIQAHAGEGIEIKTIQAKG
jgi:hypothetical protein